MTVQATPTQNTLNRIPLQVLGLPSHLAVLWVWVSSLVFLHSNLSFRLGYLVNSNRAGGARGESRGTSPPRALSQTVASHGWQLDTRVSKD